MATQDTGASPAHPISGHASGEDPRFTYQLVFDVADVLEQHGYPPPAGAGWAHLMLTLHRALYQEKP